jgi:hypothetical protein
MSGAVYGQIPPSTSTAAHDAELPATPYRREVAVLAAKRTGIHWGSLLVAGFNNNGLP